MKKTAFLIIPVIILIFACTGNSSKKEKLYPDDKTVNNIASNCNEFLDQYEEWVNSYISLLEDYMKNPMDSKLAEKYANVGQEAANWAMQWGSLYTCAAKEKYAKRFEEISEKVENKLKELGLQ